MAFHRVFARLYFIGYISKGNIRRKGLPPSVARINRQLTNKKVDKKNTK